MKKAISLLSIIIAMSCTTSKEDNNIRQIDLNPDKANKLTIGDIDKIVEIETNDSTLVAEINRIILDEQDIYIQDGKLEKIFVFDKNGKLKYQINDKGEGPNNYLELRSFAIDRKYNQLHLFDNNSKKESIYNLSGDFIEKREMPYKIKSMDFLDDGKNATVREIVDSENQEGFVINIYDNDKLIEQYIPYKYKNGVSILETNTPLISFNDHFYYKSLFNDTIFCWKNNVFAAKYIINCGNKGLPQRIKDLPQEEFTKATFDYIKNNNIIVGVSILDEEEDNLHICYMYDKVLHYCVYNEQEQTATQYCGPFFSDDFPITDIVTNAVYDRDEKKMCFILDNFKISQLEEYKKNIIKEKYPQIYSVISKTDIEDNPILLFLTINWRN